MGAMPATAAGARAAAASARDGHPVATVSHLSANDVAIGELGSPVPANVIGSLVDGLLAEWEDTAELRWPLSTAVFDRMARSDAQVDSVYRAVTLGLRRASPHVGEPGDDVREEVRKFVAVNLGVNPDGGAFAGRRRRNLTGVTFRDHMRDACTSLRFGHAVCEKVYELRPPGEELGNAAPAVGRVAYLRKLALRPARTITGWRVARDGGLIGVTQDIPDDRGVHQEVLIPVDRLVVYVNEKEGAEWVGRSIFRSSYKHWLIKDVLLRLGPQAIERNGMGVPTVYYPADGDEAKALSIAKSFRGGAEAGTALPDGYRMELLAVQGSPRDELPLVNYHDQAIGRASLTMFLNLGHDNGARSLGDTFVEQFVASLNAVLEEIAATITEHVIRDLVAVNFGDEEPYPALRFEDLTPEGAPTAEALAALAKVGILTPDDSLETDVRRRYGLPAWTPAPGNMPRGGTAPVDVPQDPGGSLPGVIDPAADQAEHADHVAAGAATVATCPICNPDVTVRRTPAGVAAAAVAADRLVPEEIAARALELGERIIARQREAEPSPRRRG